MKLKHLLFSSLMLLSAGTAWADVEINETNFPDENFRNWLLSQSYGSDGVLTDAEIAGVEEIDVQSKSIQSLKGIEYFTVLLDLNCKKNLITSLDVSKNTNLWYLCCDYNQLTFLDVSKNTKLSSLECYGNQLTSLDLSSNTVLSVLNCSNNELTSLDLSKNTELWRLYCYDNKLTFLDISKNTALATLDCYDNQLTSLDVSKNTELTLLECGDNQLTSLDVSKNTTLEKLYCGKNQLISLDVLKNTKLSQLECYDNQLTSLDVSKNTALISLYCNQNQIKDEGMDALVASLSSVNNGTLRIINNTNEQNVMTTTQVDVAKAKGWSVYSYDGNDWVDYNGALVINETNFPDENFRNWLLSQSYGSDGVLTPEEITKVSWIDVSSKSIQSLKGIEYFTALTYLNCGENQLTSLDVSKNTALTELHCYENQLTSLDVSTNTALTRLTCGDNQLTSLDVSKNTVLTGLWCYSNQLTSLDLSKNTALTVLSCFSTAITSLDVSKNTALTSLYCYDNQLTSLDLSKNTELTKLDCSNTALTELYCEKKQLTYLNISGCTALTELYCYSNQLTSLDVSTNTVLTTLWCFSNQLTSLDVSKNTALNMLDCSSNQLTSLDVSTNTVLTTLWCTSNQLTSLDVSKNTELRLLYCSSNQLTSLDVSKNANLIYLYCSKCQLTSLDISENTSLERLYCSSNQFTSLDLSNNTALDELDCSSNQLTSLDVSKNTKLSELNCSSNQLTSLDVSKNTVLNMLDCSSNQFASLDLSNIRFSSLSCYQNQIKGDAMDAFIESLPVRYDCTMKIVYNENEQNEMTTTQVAAAKAKGWKPMEYNGQNWVEYAGVRPLPPMPDLTPEELLKIDMSSSDMSGWLVDKGIKIKGSNVQVTKNIAETKYKTGSIQTADGKTHPYSYFYVPAASNTNPYIGFYLPYNLKGEYDIYLVTMPTWTYQNNFDEEKHRYRFRASIWEKNEENNFPALGTALRVGDFNTFETPEVDANVITDTTFIGTYDFQHAYTDDITPGVILQINPNVLLSQRRNFSNSIIFAGVLLVSKEAATKVEAVDTPNAVDDSAPWYTINGVKLAEKPTAAGIYIHNGKKVIVK